MNEIRENILKKIENELRPSFIEVIDESHLHANHNPDAKNGGTHFKIKVISSFFKDMAKDTRPNFFVIFFSQKIKYMTIFVVFFYYFDTNYFWRISSKI